MPDPTTDSAAQPTANGAGGTGEVNWKEEAETYKRRFTGSQQAQEKLRGELEALKGEKFDLSTKLTDAVGKLDTLTLEQKTVRDQAQAAAAEAAKLKTTNDRLSVILEFPQLAPLEGKQLLPDGTGEDLRKKLTDLSALMAGQSQAAARFEAAGATPPAPKGETPSADGLMQAMIAAQRKGDMGEYDRLYPQLLAAKRAAGKK